MAAPLEYDFRVIGRAVVEREIASLEKRFIASAARLNKEFNKLANGGAGGSKTGSSRVGGGLYAPGQKEYIAQQRLFHKQSLKEARERERAAVKAVRAERQAQDNLNRSRQSIHNQRLREEKQTRIESSKTNAQRQRDIDRQSRSQQSLARQRAREESESRQNVKSKTDFIKSTVGGGVGRVANAIGSIGRTGMAIAGIGAAGITASSISQAISLDETSRRLSIAGRDPGTKGVNPAELSKSFTRTGIATGFSPEAIAGGVRAYVAKTGDIQTALANQKMFATVAQGGDTDVTDIFNMAADMKSKLKLDTPEKMKEAFAIFSQQGKKGKFELKNMAVEMPQILSNAANAGVRGVGGARDIGAMMQMAMDATGNGSEATTAVLNMMKSFPQHAKSFQSGEAFGGRKVQIYEGGDSKNPTRSLGTIMAESISASRGDMGAIYKKFGIRGKKALDPMMNAYKDAYHATKGTDTDKDKAGQAAVKAEFSKYRDLPADFKDVEADAADAMKSFSVQMEIINTKLKDAIASQLFPEIVKLIPQIAALVPMVSKLVAGFLQLASWLIDNPLKGLGAAVGVSIAYELAKAGIAKLFADSISAVVTGYKNGGFSGAGSALIPSSVTGGQSFKTSFGNALGPGLSIGTAVGGAILATGIGKFEAGENSMNVGGAALNTVRGAKTSDLEVVRQAIVEQRKRAAEAHRMDFGDSFLDTFGASNKAVEAKTQDSYLSEMEKKYAELQMQAAKEQSEAAKALKDAATSLSGSKPNTGDKPSPIKTP